MEISKLTDDKAEAVRLFEEGVNIAEEFMEMAKTIATRFPGRALKLLHRKVQHIPGGVRLVLQADLD